MTTKPTAIISEMVSRLIADATLAGWASTNFSRTIKYYVGVDDQDQPESSNCPFVAFRLGSMSAADDRSHRMIRVDVALVISDTTADTVSGQTTTMTGLAKLQDFYYHVERAFDAWFSMSDYNYTATYSESLFEASRPLMRLTFSVTVQGDY